MRVDDRAVVDAAERCRVDRRLAVLGRQDDRGAAGQAVRARSRCSHPPDLRVDVVERAGQQRAGRAVGVVAAGQPVGRRQLLRRRHGLEVHPEDRRRADRAGCREWSHRRSR